MFALEAIDKLEIWVLIDNSSDSLSSLPDNVENDFKNIENHGEIISGAHMCRPHHGLSLLLIASRGEQKHLLLFDSGPESGAIKYNCSELRVPLGDIESIVLSHGHWDHAGGLLSIIKQIKKHREDKELTCYVNPGMFCRRGLKDKLGNVHPMQNVPSVEALRKAGATLIDSTKPNTILDNMFYVSGEIPRVTSYELGLANHVSKSILTSKWEDDPLILDERFVMVNIHNKGLFVFTACSHAGLINVLMHAQSLMPEIPMYGVIGGFHLSGLAMEQRIPYTVEDIKKFNLQYIIPSHCTGWHAVTALVNALGESKIVPSAVGDKFYF